MAAHLDVHAVPVTHAALYQGTDALIREPLTKPEASVDLATLWRNLVNGTWFARSGFCSENECFLVVERLDAAPRAPAPHVVEMLEQVLTGESQKVLAIDGCLSRSTIATRCASCLRGMGRQHTLSRVPMLVLLAAHAARGATLGPATLRAISATDRECSLVRCERPDRALRATLSEAESAVVGLLVEGCTHSQMAIIRNTSPRTIANQLGSSFRKLGASGRTALLSRALQCKAPPTLLPTSSVGPHLHTVREQPHPGMGA